MNLLPNARTLPVVQASPTGHARAATQFFRQHLKGMPLRRTNRIPARQRRSGKRGRPPLGLEGSGGSSGSISSHNKSGSSGAAIAIVS